MATYKKLQVTNKTSDFRKAVEIVEVPIPTPGPGQVLVKNHYAGVNATDINISAGRYFTDGITPYDIGFEGLGVVEKIGAGVTDFKVGQPVMVLGIGSYGEYFLSNNTETIPIPQLDPKYIALLICGLTASIGLSDSGKIKAGDKVLITAAAGGTGHIAVQWAKSKGCTVIGTTSSAEKAAFLKGLGCDHVINYREEDISTALKRDFPDGVDVIWETIGGEIAEKLLDNLAEGGRMVVVGGIVGYKSEGFPLMKIKPGLICMKSQTITGFLLTGHADKFEKYLKLLITETEAGKLKIVNDLGQTTKEGPFKTIEDAVRGVEHLHTGKSTGKVTVQLR
jgi:hypothetical protein